MTPKSRQRAPSKRSLETRARILDAAEALFAERGFDGASIRDIAARAGTTGPLVHHHGGSKEALFHTIVARRADTLASLRRDALATLGAETRTPDLRQVLRCFVDPLLTRVLGGDTGWAAYGRLIAHVSADARWRDLTAAHFDPTVELFLSEIARVLPTADRARLGAHFVFMVSAMLSVCASRWRITTFSPAMDDAQVIDLLLDHACAGFATA